MLIISSNDILVGSHDTVSGLSMLVNSASASSRFSSIVSSNPLH